jgi:hypothetical protein
MLGRLTALALLLVAGSSHAQEAMDLPLLEPSRMLIEGTSNKSDWTVDVTQLEGRIWLTIEDDSFRPDSMKFSTRVEDMKSGRSSIMDRLMYDALRSDEHPEILYSIGAEGITERGVVEDTTVWSTIGILDLAGVRDTLSASVRGYRDGDGHFVFEGSHAMSMREHDIEPPTAMFGALRTRDQITISFDLVFGE